MPGRRGAHVPAVVLLFAKSHRVACGDRVRGVRARVLHPGGLLHRAVHVPPAPAQEAGARRDAAWARSEAMIDVRMFTVGPVQENCFIVRAEGRGAALIVDPGDEADKLLRRRRRARDRDASRRSSSPTRTSTTSARSRRSRRRPAPRSTARARDARCWRTSWTTSRGRASARSRATRPTTRSPAARRSSSPGFTIDVIFTPGHSPGHVTYAIRRRGRAVLGRRPVPGLGRAGRPAGRRLADAARLDRVAGRRRTPPETTVYPGPHGDHDARARARHQPVPARARGR